ncbi:Error-prone repair protein UmuD [Bacteroidales bacterium CF]|jgi:DNA polymerase V|nr:Error-prone repair protein UmuD [Bacteroidales bacterium CF]NCB98329.1 translesion error-prone DNA polymerase V autoproteolytic subunit [Bacteroidia bacterium]
MKNREIEIFSPEINEPLFISVSDSPVHAGFPSPAENIIENKLDLNKLLVKNPSSTFFAKVSGESMIDDGVDDGDILVIDKSVTPYDGAIAVCYLDGEFTLKRVRFMDGFILLVPSNSKFKSIKVDKDNEFLVWGVVRYIIKKR